MRLLLNENGSITFVITQLVVVKRDRKNLFTIISSRFKFNIHFFYLTLALGLALGAWALID